METNKVQYNLQSLEIESRNSIQQGIITRLSNDLITASMEELDAVIQGSMGVLGKYFKADRVALFLLSEDKMTASNSHEWCAEGLRSQKSELVDVNLALFPFWRKKVENPGLYYANKYFQDAPLGEDEKKLLDIGNVDSVLGIPALVKSQLVGFLVIDNPSLYLQSGELDKDFLMSLGSLIGGGVYRFKREFKKSLPEVKYENSIRALDNFVLELVEAEDENKVYELFAREVRRLAGRAMVVVNSYDEEAGGVTTRAIGGLDSYLIGILKKLGLKMEGKFYPLDKTSQPFMFLSENRLIKVEGGLYELTFESLPKALCRQVENLISIKEIYACGLVSNKQLVGTVSLLLLGHSLENKAEIEMLSRIFSTALMRMRSQYALELSQKKHHQLVETMSEGVLGRDNQGYIRYVNKSFCNISGYMEEDLLGKPIEFFMVDEQDTHEIRRRFKDRLEGLSERYEVRIRHKNGSIIWLAVSAVPWRNEHGDIIGSIGVNSDITLRKETEDKLKEAQNQLIHAAELAKIAPWKMDLTEGVIYLSRGVREALGIIDSNKLSIAEYLEKYIHPSDRAYLRAKLDYVKNNFSDLRFKDEFEYRLVLSNGDVRVFFVRGYMESPGVIMGMSQDITDIKEAKDMAFYSEWKFRDLMQQSSDGIILLDSHGQILEWNNQMERISGKRADEVVEQALWDIGFESQPPLFGDNENEASNVFHDFYIKMIAPDGVEEFIPFEFETVDPNKDKRTFVYSAFPVFSLKEAYVCVMVRDITKVKQQQELQKSLEISQKTAEIKQQFLANMGHEMRTPLNGIMGMLEILKTTALSPSQNEFVDIARQSSESLLYLINNILELTKMEAGKIDNSPVRFSVSQILNRAEGLFKSAAIEKGIQLIIEKGAELFPHMMADEQKISQAISNLISNAIKFTPEGGKVVVTASLRQAEGGKAAIKVHVKDTGIGIAQARLHLIFEKFSQIDDSNTRAQDGAGLGLLITRNLVKVMGGEVGVNSNLGQGSDFWFEIPVSLIPEDSKAKEKESVDNCHRVLIVEPRLLHQKLLSIMIQNRDCPVDIASSGGQAIEMFMLEEPDIVVIDTSIPDMEAAHLAERLEKSGSGRKIHFVLSSDSDLNSEELREGVFEHFLQKPISEQDLSAILKKIKSGR